MKTSRSPLTTATIASQLTRIDRAIEIDMHELGSVTDYFIVCTAPNAAVMRESIAELKRLAQERGVAWAVERDREWTLIDLDGIVVHLFAPTGRKFWRLDQLWASLPQREIVCGGSVAVA